MPPEGTVKWKARAVEHRRAAGYPLELDQPPRLPHRSRHAGPWQTGPVPTGAQRTLDRFLRDAAACAGNRHAGNADRKQARPTNIRDEFRADDLRVLQPGSESTMSIRSLYRRHSPQFKLTLCADIRNGKIGRREAKRTYQILANLIQLWLSQYDRGELNVEEAAATT